jgi:hypothetical protein
VDIAPGTELTLCYAKPNRLSSAEVLLSWGFYPSTRPTDWAFNQHVHALPALPFDAVVTAAVTLLLAKSSSSSSSGVDGQQVLDANMQGRLLAVVGSLPLQLPPELLLLQAAGSAAAAAAAAETSYVPYAHAAAVALKYGLNEDALQPLEVAAAAAAAGDGEVSPIAAERFKAPSPQQRELAQVRTTHTLHLVGTAWRQSCIRVVLWRSSIRLRICQLTGVPDQQNENLVSWSMQHWLGQRPAVFCVLICYWDQQVAATLLQLMYCPRYAQAAFIQDVLELTVTGSSSFNNSTSTGANVPQQQQQLQQCCARALAYECSIRLLACSTTIQQDEQLLKQLIQPPKVAAGTAGDSKKGASKAGARSKGFGARAVQQARADNSKAAQLSTEQQQQQERQQGLLVLAGMQQQVLRQLLVLEASSIVKRGSSSSSSSSSADAQAAQRVLAEVQLLPPPKLADLAALQQQQLDVLQKLQDRQQQQQGLSTEALLAREELGLARVIAAVEARLRGSVCCSCVQICASSWRRRCSRPLAEHYKQHC